MTYTESFEILDKGINHDPLLSLPPLRVVEIANMKNCEKGVLGHPLCLENIPSTDNLFKHQNCGALTAS
jgi:hypothetical protein